MSLPQEDSFLNRQNCRSNMGLIENPMGAKFDLSQNAIFQNGSSNSESLKPKLNFSGGIENDFKQQSHHQKSSSGKNILCT